MKRTHLPWTPLQRLLMLAAGLVCAGTLAALLLALPSLPAQLPTRYAPDGSAAHDSGKGLLFIPAGLAAAAFLSLLLLSFFPDAWNTVREPLPERRIPVLRATRTFLCTVTLTVVMLLCGASLSIPGWIPAGVLLACMIPAILLEIILGILFIFRAHTPEKKED